MSKDSGIVTELGVASVPNSIAYYVDELGFSIEETADDAAGLTTWAELSWGSSRLMLQVHADLRAEMPSVAERPGTSSAVLVIRMRGDDARVLHSRLNGRSSPLIETDYGTVEFHCADPDGYTVLVAGR